MRNIICFKIVDISSSGITVKIGERVIRISFDECAENYAEENSLENSRCVATRDITKMMFTFYTRPKISVVFKKHLFENLISGKTAVDRFWELQKTINKYGYTSYDLS